MRTSATVCAQVCVWTRTRVCVRVRVRKLPFELCTANPPWSQLLALPKRHAITTACGGTAPALTAWLMPQKALRLDVWLSLSARGSRAIACMRPVISGR